MFIFFNNYLFKPASIRNRNIKKLIRWNTKFKVRNRIANVFNFKGVVNTKLNFHIV